jgi:cobalt-zinc-cadmium efflux system protein
MAHAREHRDGHDHDHPGHDHDHGGHDDHRGHGHVHAPASFGKAFAIGIALNAGFVVLEVVYGLLSNSVALLADAGHNISDVLGLAVAWTAAVLSKRAPTQRFTYGLGGTSILANAAFLLVVIGGLSWEAIGRFWNPQPVAGKTMMIVAAVGILINGFCAWLFASGRKGDLNIRGAFAHMAGRLSPSASSSPVW